MGFFEERAHVQGEKKRGGSVITDVFIIIAWEGLAERKRK